MTQPEAIAQWLAEYATPKRRRLWERQWDRAGFPAMRAAIARGDCVDPCDPPPPIYPE